jgi:glycosyltransferase involved in cell wall biosynthesis
MRILHAVTNADLGGAPRVVTELCWAQAAAGHEVAAASVPTGPFWDSLDPRVRRFPLGFLRREISPLNDIRAVAELRALFASWRPDIIHLHSSKIGVLGRVAAPWALRRRTVYTIRKTHRAFLPLERLLAPRCGAVVPVSAYDERGLKEEGLRGRIVMIPNGVSDRRGRQGADADAVRALRGARGGGALVVLSVARLAAPKRFDLFVEAARRFSFAEARFFWIGNPTSRETLEPIYGPLPPNLTLLGELAEAGDYVNECDVFMLLSDYEGLPMSVLEALACAKPVVASRVGGIPEALGGGAGVVTDNEVAAVEAAIRSFMPSAARRDAGVASRAHYEERYTVSAMAAAYEALYKELLR